MYAYYIERGHSIKELLKLSFMEKLFYIASKEVIEEELNKNGQ